MNKIKILRIITRMNVGGPAIHVSILSELDNEMFRTQLISGIVENNEKEIHLNDILTWKLVSSLKKSLNLKLDIQSIKIILFLIKKYQPDIIHTHLSKAGLVGRIACIIYNLTHKKKIKLIHTYHGTVFKHYFGFFKSKLYLYIDRFLALFTDKIIAISESQKQDLIRFGFNKKKIEIVKLGIDLKPFLYDKKIEKKDILKVGIIGRLEPIKNHKMFLDTIKRLKDFSSKQRFHFYIIGDGSLSVGLQEYMSYLDIIEYVHFIGNVSREELPDHYKMLDCVVNCSLNEGTPLSIIEAMASGCLVIATNVGGTKDLFGNSIFNTLNGAKYCDNGFLVESNNYKQLSMMLRYFSLFYDTNYIQDKIKKAKEFVIDNYSKERLLSDIDKLYKKVF